MRDSRFYGPRVAGFRPAPSPKLARRSSLGNYIATVRRIAILLVGILAGILVTSTVVVPGALGATRSNRAWRSINPCTLLTAPQATTVLGAESVGGAFRYPRGCSWHTNPTDGTNPSYVTIEVQPLKKLLGKKYRNVRTYLEKSTTVGIDALPGVGDEAFSTYSALSGPGTSDGMTVRVGKNVISIGFQRSTPVANPSPQLDQIVTIVKTIVPTLRGR